MPDLLTHLSVAYLLGRISRLDSSKNAIFLLGAIMSDIERFLLLFSSYLGSMRAEQFFIRMLSQPFHSILGIGLLAVVIVSFFPEENSMQTFKLLILGGFLHLLLDMLMWPWAGGYTMFFPLQGAKYTYSFRLIWPGNTTLPTLIGIPTSILLVYERRKGIIDKKSPNGAGSTTVPSPLPEKL
ncbi:MAG: metal-dependent hydrolase [Candidatus Hodarchaeota archaeon]